MEERAGPAVLGENLRDSRDSGDTHSHRRRRSDVALRAVRSNPAFKTASEEFSDTDARRNHVAWKLAVFGDYFRPGSHPISAEADHVKDRRCVTRRPTRASQISLSISGWTGGVFAAVLMVPVG